MIVRSPPCPLLGVVALLLAVVVGFGLERGLREATWPPEVSGCENWLPNYRHVWFAHAPAFVSGGQFDDPYCWTGASLKTFKNNWRAWCHLDDDNDGLSNGAELGDPCCRWSSNASTKHFSLGRQLEYRRWGLSHPGRPSDVDFVRTSAKREPSGCGEYDEAEYARQFRSFYFEGADGPKEPTNVLIVKIASVLVLFVLVGEWFWRRQLARDICPWLFRVSMLSPRVSCAVFAASYIYMDVTSGIVHLILDYAPSWLPIIGPLARGFQYHHFDPTAIIRISWYEYVSHVHLLCPLVAALLVLGRASRVQRLFWFWGSVNTHLFQTAHRWAHFPPETLPAWVHVLQRLGLVITHERHMHHHEDLQQQFTILSGWTDVVVDTFSEAVPPWRYDAWMLLGVVWFVFPILLDVCFRDYFDSLDASLTKRKIAVM